MLIMSTILPGNAVHEGVKQCLDVSLVDWLLLKLEPRHDAGNQLCQITSGGALKSASSPSSAALDTALLRL
jgi:hypothetical protein